MKLNNDQAAALEYLLAMPVTGQGGWQTRMRKFHAAFGSSPNEGVSNDQRLLHSTINTRAAATVAPAKPVKAAGNGPSNVIHDPISRIEALTQELADLAVTAETNLTNQIERLRKVTTAAPVATRKAVTATATVEAPEPVKRKARKSIKRSRAMKAAWAARKAAATVRTKGKR